MSRINRNSKASGFSLVELLVVISIVALLMSILLPTLKNARRMGISIQCSARMRQVAGSTLAYQNDYKEYFPPSVEFKFPPYVRNPTSINTGQFYDDSGNNTRNTNWTDRIMPYLGATGPMQTAPGVLDTSYDGLRKVFHCPAVTATVLGSPGTIKDYTHFGINLFLSAFSKINYGVTAERAQDVRRPSQVFLNAETGFGGIISKQSCGNPIYAMNNGTFVDFRRHGEVTNTWPNAYFGSTGGANYTYPDGHGGSLDGNTLGLVLGTNLNVGCRADPAAEIDRLWNATK